MKNLAKIFLFLGVLTAYNTYSYSHSLTEKLLVKAQAVRKSFGADMALLSETPVQTIYFYETPGKGHDWIRIGLSEGRKLGYAETNSLATIFERGGLVWVYSEPNYDKEGSLFELKMTDSAERLKFLSIITQHVSESGREFSLSEISLQAITPNADPLTKSEFGRRLNMNFASIWRKSNLSKPYQDRMAFFQLPQTQKDAPRALLVVFDGHGYQGDFVAQWCLDRVVLLVTNSPHYGKKGEEETLLVEVAAQLNASLADRREATYSGTTAVFCLIGADEKATVANIGDSRIIGLKLGKEGILETVEISKDHSTSSEDEQKRVEKAKGVIKDGRLWVQDKPATNTTRGLGDFYMMGSGYIADPELFSVDLRELQYLLLGTDGLWDHCSNEIAANLLSPFDYQPLSLARSLYSLLLNTQPQYFKRIQSKPKKFVYYDDTSLMIVQMESKRL